MVTAIEVPQPPNYTEDEKRALVDFLLALKKQHIQTFLKAAGLSQYGAKAGLRERLQMALDKGRITYKAVVDFLDSLAPWGKQHVYLYTGPRGDLGPWKDAEAVHQRLKSLQLGGLFNARLPLVLPERLTLSSITHRDGKLRVTAVQKREYAERVPEHDEARETGDGTTIEFRAYVQHISRTLVAFEWDLNANTAMLQITQLQREADYNQLAKDFFQLLDGWLDIQQFGPVDVRPAVKKLHQLEADGRGETRSHGIHYDTPRGRRFSGHSPSARDSVLGELSIDSAMEVIREVYVVNPNETVPALG